MVANLNDHCKLLRANPCGTDLPSAQSASATAVPPLHLPRTMSVIPTAEDISASVRSVRASAPDLGILKVLAAIKLQQKDWQLSEARLRKVMKEQNLSLPHPSQAPLAQKGKSKAIADEDDDDEFAG